WIRLHTQAAKFRPRVRKSINANAEPCHAVAAANSHNAEGQNNDYASRLVLEQKAEVQQNNHRNEDPQKQQKLSLRDEVGFAGLVDQFRHFAHGAMYGQIFQSRIDSQTESQPKNTKKDTDHEQAMAVHAQKSHR